MPPRPLLGVNPWTLSRLCKLSPLCAIQAWHLFPQHSWPFLFNPKAPFLLSILSFPPWKPPLPTLSICLPVLHHTSLSSNTLQPPLFPALPYRQFRRSVNASHASIDLKSLLFWGLVNSAFTYHTEYWSFFCIRRILSIPFSMVKRWNKF